MSLDILKDALLYVYQKENAFIYDEIIGAEFVHHCILVEFSVFNAGVVYWVSMLDDIPDNISDQHRVYEISRVVDDVVDFKQQAKEVTA